MRGIRTLGMFAMLAAVVSTTIVGAAPLQGCAALKAEEPVFQKVEQTVLDYLEHGQALEDLETAVATLVPQGSDVDAIINAAIDLLHSTGVLPPDVLTRAAAMQGKLAAKRPGGFRPAY